MSENKDYCRDCDRSIYGKYHDCDINIENNGEYVMADSKCYCKIVNGKRAEKYPWDTQDDEKFKKIEAMITEQPWFSIILNKEEK